MKTNVGTVDRIIRILVAVVLVTLYFTKVLTGGWAIAAIIVAAILGLTSLFGVCPVYTLLGIHTTRTESV
jgi:hypothetical protein